LVTAPAPYSESDCCRAPILPLLSRDVHEAGLICQHCHGTLIPFDEIPAAAKDDLGNWAADYAKFHSVAHWDDAQQRQAGNYDEALENAAKRAEGLLRFAGQVLAPKLIEFYPSVVWEDQDECLEVRPEDILF
jgi:hypothetical protein